MGQHMDIDREKAISVVRETEQRLSLERARLIELRERIASIEAQALDRFKTCDLKVQNLNAQVRSQSKH